MCMVLKELMYYSSQLSTQPIYGIILCDLWWQNTKHGISDLDTDISELPIFLCTHNILVLHTNGVTLLAADKDSPANFTS